MLSTVASAQSPPEPLASHHWRHRIVLLYAPTADAPELQRFDERLAERRCAVRARDLVAGVVIGDERGHISGRSLGPNAVRALREKHGIGGERVATVLVGKDGGRKLVVDGVAELERVFERIDAMPMRQREAREREDPGCP